MAYLRLNNGYSREELAQKIGISADVITQWEIGVLTPDVGDVLALSNLYGVSVDDILRSQIRMNDIPVPAQAQPQESGFTEQTVHTAQNAAQQPQAQAAYTQSRQTYQAPQQENQYHAPQQEMHTNAHTAQHEENKKGNGFVNRFFDKAFHVYGKALAPSTARLMFVFPFSLLVVGVYLFAGNVLHVWHPSWLMFLLIPCYYMIAASLKARSFKSFLFMMPVPIVIVMLFLFCGFFLHIWHPTWMLFLLIPAYYWSVAVFVKKRHW